MEKRITINESFSGPGFTVKAEPIEHVFDDDKLGEGPAKALAKLVSEQIKAITETASGATIAARERGRRALARGAGWAVERYRGRAPTGSRRLFNDSGTFADLVAQLAAGVWQVVTAGNRLDQPRFGDAADFADMMRRLRELVPALRAPLEQPEVRKAVETEVAAMIKVGRAR